MLKNHLAWIGGSILLGSKVPAISVPTHLEAAYIQQEKEKECEEEQTNSTASIWGKLKIYIDIAMSDIYKLAGFA